MSIVSSTGILVNKLSTSNDAKVSFSFIFVDLIIFIKSFVELTTYFEGMYFCIIEFNSLATVYVGEPMFEIIGLSGGSYKFLWILGFP